MWEKILGFFSKNLAMDLGTANSLIYLKGQGIVLNEPSVVAISRDSGEVTAVGKAAKDLVGRTHKKIVTIRPLKDGVIADFEVTSVMIKYFLGKVLQRRSLVKPRLIVAVPTGITQVEKRAVIESAEQAGAREVHLIEEPMAAAIGAGLPIDKPIGNMVVDIGGGTTEVAVISLCAVAYSESVRVAGDETNEAVLRYIQRNHQMAIGENLAEEIKMKIGSAYQLPEPLSMKISGKELVSGIPKTFEINDEEIREAIKEPVNIIVEAVRRALEKTPPELAGDIGDNGIWLAGGGALLRGLDRLIAEEINIKVNVAEDPLTTVARGSGVAIENFDFYKQVFIN